MIFNKLTGVELKSSEDYTAVLVSGALTGWGWWWGYGGGRLEQPHPQRPFPSDEALPGMGSVPWEDNDLIVFYSEGLLKLMCLFDTFARHDPSHDKSPLFLPMGAFAPE